MTSRTAEPSLIEHRSGVGISEVLTLTRTDPAEARRLGVALIGRRLRADHLRLADHTGSSITPNDGTAEIWSDGGPWGCANVRTEHFLFIADATALPAGSELGVTLGDLGIRSLLHLPLRDRHRSLGAVDVAWGRSVPDWDDEDGPLVRNLARLLLHDR